MSVDASAVPETNPPPRRRRVWLRRLAVVLVILVVLLVVSPLALALPFVRDLVASKMSDVVGRPVAIRKAFAFWGKGIDLEGVRVDSPDGFPAPLATVRRVHVEVNVLGLLTGRGLDADVQVHAPWITFQEDAEGRSNAEGLFPDRGADDEDRGGDGSSPGRVHLQVTEGVIRASRPGEEVPQELGDIELDVLLEPEGGLALTFTGLAKRAVVGGGDAAIEASLHLPTEGEGPVKIHVPPLDLSRIGRVLGGATGITGLQGHVELHAEGTARPGPTLSGEAGIRAENLAFRTADGNPVRVGRVEFDGKFLGETKATVGDVELLLEDVVLGPGPLSHEGYREPRIVLRMRAQRSPEDVSAPSTLLIERAESRLLSFDTASEGAPLSITASDDGVGVQGLVNATLDLASLGRAFGRALGIERGESLGGQVVMQTRFALANGEGGVNSSLLGRQVRLPASWSAGVPATEITGRANVTVSRDTIEVVVPNFEGLGIQLQGRAVLPRADGGGGLPTKARVDITGDLARTRPLLAPLMSLERQERIAGRLEGRVTLEAEEGRRRLRGKTVLTGLRWHDADGRLVVDEPRVEIVQDILLAAEEGGRHDLDALRLVSTGLTAELSGRAEGVAKQLTVEGRLTLSGDAARLAPTLARYLGEDYADLTGQGPIAGRLEVRSKPDQGLRSTLASGRIEPGSWSAGGLTLTTPELRLAREDESRPQQVLLTSGVNDGRLDFRADLTPEAERVGWQATLQMARVDTAPLVVDHGLGRYLALFFPTILPASGGANVLSGRLDADLQLTAADLGGEQLLPSLRGKGKVDMTDGSIGESTLFRAVGREKGLGDIGRALAAAVPEVGRELEGLSRALTFQRVTSSFDIAQEILTIRHGLLEGSRVRIGFTGRVGLREERVDLKVPVTLSGKGGERLGRVLPTKTIPLTIQGPLEKPRITPDLKLTDLSGGALDGLLPGDGNPVDRIKDLFGR